MTPRKSSRATGTATTPRSSAEPPGRGGPDGSPREEAAGTPWLCEPTTTITDYLLAGLTAWFAASLLRRGWAGGEAAVALWGAAFASTAAAALLGGTVHGFAPRLGEARKALLWRATLVLAALTGFCLLAGASLSAAPPPWRAPLIALAGAKLVVSLGLLVRSGDFRFVLYDSGASLLLVLALEVYALLGAGAPGAGWIVAGVVLSLVAAAVQHSGVSLHRHFNHNDLYHVLQMGAAYLLFRGGLLL